MSFWVLLAIVAMILLILVGVLRAPRSPGRLSLILAALCGIWWTVCVLARHSSSDPAFIVFAAKLAWFGIMGVPLFWSLSFIHYARGTEGEKPWQINTIFAVIALVGGLALTNDWHHGIYGDVIDVSKARFTHGPVYSLAMTTAYVMMGGTFLYALSRLPSSHGVHRWQLVLLLFAALIPWAANVGFNLYSLRLFDDDPTPFVFAVTGVTILAGQHFARLFVLPPIGRDAIFAVLPDPVLVFDEDDRIIELNPAAAQLPGIPKNPIGARLSEPSELAELLRNGCFEEGERREIHIAAAAKTFELSYHSLLRWGRAGGRMFLLRDITLRKADEIKMNALSRDLQERLLDNIRLQRQLKDEAARDHLTGLFNRRQAHNCLPRLLADPERNGSCALVILDIDHFKSFNDRYGHDIGDEVIRAFGNILKSDPRVEHHAFRWGGEEFLAFVAHADAEEALARCSAWRAAFAATDLGGAVDVPRTFSAGIHVVAAGATTSLDEAIKAADTALYEAKRAGRNRAFVSNPAEGEARTAVA